MRILHLTLKAVFYDMIAAGVKPEEYREIKPFWVKRFVHKDIIKYASVPTIEELKMPYGFMTQFEAIKIHFDAVKFARGGHFDPKIPQMLLEMKDIIIRTGNPDWGAEEGKEYFVIKLGQIISPCTTI